VLEGKVTKVVAFGAFVEILPGVEGLVHISELADHHVENPSEVVEPGSVLNVKILEIDEERRRLSLSIKRVEGQNMPLRDLGAQVQEAQQAQVEATPADAPDLDLSEEVFSEPPPEVASEEPVAESGGAADPPRQAEEPVPEPAEPQEGDEAAHEGESSEERPDAPDDSEEAAGEEDG
jgi:small subunit ribosomal protein S1